MHIELQHFSLLNIIYKLCKMILYSYVVRRNIWEIVEYSYSKIDYLLQQCPALVSIFKTAKKIFVLHILLLVCYCEGQNQTAAAQESKDTQGGARKWLKMQNIVKKLIRKQVCGKHTQLL